MRIISGQYKGRKIDMPKVDSIRPTTDKVREALFSIMQNRLNGSVFLDLFAGSGAMGIEACSRYAKEVIMIDNSFEAIKLINNNMSFIENDKPTLIKSDYCKFLKQTEKKFDIIFMDPPYENLYTYKKALKVIAERNLLNDDGLIICEHKSIYDIKSDLHKKIDRRKYGQISVTIFTHKQ